MKPKTLLVLVALVAVLGAFIWFVDRDLPSTDERAERAKKVFAGLEAKEITALTIERDGVKIALERDAASSVDSQPGPGSTSVSPPESPGWRLVAPLSARADRAAVDAFVAALTGLERERTVVGADRKAMGLEPPRAKVTLRTAAGEHRLEVGAEVPASANLALAVDGSADVGIAPKSFWSDLAKPPGDWRARDLFPGQRDQVERLSLAGPAGRVVLVRRAGELWVESPYADRADRDAVSSLLADLTGLRAEKFLDGGDAAAMGLVPARATLEATVAGRSAPVRIELGAAAADPSHVAARVDGVLVEISRRLDEAAGRTPEAWRSRSWSSFDTWSVDAVKAQDGGGALELTRHEGDWKRGAESIPYSSIGDLLYAVAGIKAERFGEVAAPGGAPSLTLELAGAGDKHETLSVWTERDGLVPARVTGREVTLLLPKAGVDDLRTKLAAVRAARPIANATPSAASTAPSPAAVAKP